MQGADALLLRVLRVLLGAALEPSDEPGSAPARRSPAARATNKPSSAPTPEPDKPKPCSAPTNHKPRKVRLSTDPPIDPHLVPAFDAFVSLVLADLLSYPPRS